MSYTQPPKFLTLKQFLQEGEDDMFVGLKNVINDVATAWSGGSREKVEKQRIASLKQLTPAQLAILTRNVNQFISQTLQNLGTPPNYELVTGAINTTKEAKAAVAVFLDLANSKDNLAAAAQSKIADLARGFLHSATSSGIISKEEQKRLFDQIISRTDRLPGSKVVQLFAEHHEFFKRVFTLDPQLGLHPAAGSELLNRMLSNTPEANRKDAIVHVANGLQRFRFVCLQMIEMLKKEGLNRGPAPAPADPSKNDKHPAKTPLTPAPAAPVTT